MGERRGRRPWFLVVLLLVSAIGMLSALLLPEVFRPDDGGLPLLSAGLRGDVTDPTPAPDEAPAPPKTEAAAGGAGAVTAAEELPPYGDKNLARDESIRGRVTDADGEPVADAILVAVHKDTRSYPYRLELASKVRSEPDGTFVLGPLERRSYWILAVHEAHGVAFTAGQMPGAWVDLALTPGARVKGKVTDRATGDPVAGARVIVRDWNFFTETETAEDGTYLLAPLPATTNQWSGHEVVVVAEGFARGERTNLLLKSGVDEEVDFALGKGRTLSGKVLDKQTLRPVAGAVVAEGWEPYHRTTTTDEHGSYALANVETAPNLVFTVRADKYLPQQRQSDGSGSIEFQLDASLALGGKIRDPRDRPVEGARVYLHRIQHAPGYEGGRNNRAQTVVETDSEGAYRFENVSPGKVAVVAFARDYAPGEFGPVEVILGAPARTDVDVVLKHGLTVEGEVRDLKDQPIPSIRVQLSRWGWRAKGYKWINRYIWSESPAIYTDAEGKFVLKGATPGKHSLYAWDRTYGWAWQQVEGEEGQRITGLIISFAGSTIEGTFTTAAGEPVAGVYVRARGPKNTPRQQQRWVQTDALGRFKLGGLKDGAYDVTASTNMGNPEPVKDVPAGTTGVELKLKASQLLTGDVRSVLSGRPLERFTVSIQPKRGPGNRRRGGTNWTSTLRAPNGRFERPVMAGTYTVTVKARGHAPQALEEVVVEEHIAPQSLFFRLDAGGGIQGTVRDAEGKTLPFAWVRARVYRAPGEKADRSDWLLGGNDRADSRGRYFIEGLSAGTFLVELNMGNKGSAREQVVVAGREMVEREIRLLPTGTVTLRVVDPDGNPLAGVMFYFRDEATNNYVGWARATNAQGVTTSNPLRMGPAVVQARHNKNEWVTENFHVTVPPGKNTSLDVTMKKKE